LYRAFDWMEDHARGDDELRRFRTEVAALLGLQKRSRRTPTEHPRV
jgi:hypothetical protein